MEYVRAKDVIDVLIDGKHAQMKRQKSYAAKTRQERDDSNVEESTEDRNKNSGFACYYVYKSTINAQSHRQPNY